MYKNPVIPGFYPDPSVCRVGEDYYLVTSSFEYFPGVPIFQSKDLIHWKQIGHCLTRKSQLDLDKARCSGGIFAPTLRYHDGTFYMITTNVTGGGNFYVIAKDPAGEWSDPVWVDSHMFDPSLLFDDYGKVYYTRRANGYKDGIVQAEIDIKSGKLLEEPRQIISQGFCSEDVEGPHLYKIGSYYYLLNAEGGTRYGHMVTIGRSANPYGPFEPCPHNPILTHRHRPCHPIRYTGHGDLVEAQDGSWWMVFLGTRHYTGHECFHHMGRETFLAPVTWTEDGWPVVNKNGSVELEMEVPTLSQLVPEKETARDDFDGKRLKLPWNFIRNPYEEDWSLSERPGYLRLNGSGITLNDVDSPAFVGRRIDDFEFKASTRIEFNPRQENEEAGLTVLLSDKYHMELAVTLQEGKRTLTVRRRMDELSLIPVSVPIGEGDLLLMIQGHTREFSFGYSLNGCEPVELSRAQARYVSSEMAGGWTGAYIGMYATGNGRRSTVPADFDWFEYA